MKKQNGNSKYDPKYCKEIVDYFDVQPYEEVEKVIFDKKGNEHLMYVKEPVDLPLLSGFAAKIGVSRDTVNEWSRVHPEFSDAVKRAKTLQERILITNGLRGHYNPAFAIFTSKNILGWKDNRDDEGTVVNVGVVILPEVKKLGPPVALPPTQLIESNFNKQNANEES